MVAAFDYCLFGRGGAAPSIDTAMHGLVDAAHVDHLHPDSGIALATAADGEALTRDCFGDRVVWVPWRRPGFQLGLDIAAIRRANPQAIGTILGGHGITAWGDTSEAVRGQLPRHHPDGGAVSSRSTASPNRSGPSSPGYEPLPDRATARAADLLPVVRGLASTDRPQVGHFTDADVVLDFLAREAHPRLAALGHVVPGPLPADQGAPARPRPAADRARSRTSVARLRELHAAYRDEYRGLLRAARDARTPADARRGPGDRAGPGRRDVQLRRQQADRAGRRRVLRQRDQRDARRRGAVHLRAHRRVGEVPDRVLGARGGEAPPHAAAEAARDAGRVRDRRRVRHRQGDRASPRGRGRVRRRRRHRRGATPRPSPREIGGTGRGRQRDLRRDRRGADRRRVPGRRPRVRRRRPRRQQRRPLDLQAARRDDPRATGTSSTTSWPAGRSSSRARPPGSCATRRWAATSSTS